ncbi:hypothetical protein FO519_008108 [Halicephalobus sp. NKZ332]|nr:hypothetical protein FO519_008108 [Halicephalobus sp. NKZ332]
MISQRQYCVNDEYFIQKLSTPSSSIDASDHHHHKASSSDSCYSKDEAADVPGEIKYRPPRSQMPAMTCFNFDATNQDEISFKRGSKVYVKQNHAHDDQYVYIELDNGKGGYAPKQFLQLVGRTPPIIEASEVEQADKPIGEGTFSKVYIARFKGEQYALKEYKEPCFEKAKHEAECLNAMDHINIVKVFGLCRNPVFMLMEFCEGDQLVKLIKRKGFNPPLRVLMNWALQVAEGLWHMHNQDIPICHSDIKPSNIMIKERPCECQNINYYHEDSDFCSVCGLRRLSRLTLKLTDFGLARPISSETNARHSLVGSAPYMAPEYIREMKMTPKADVWSFGVFVWELLTKQTPYQDATNDEKAAIMMGIGRGLLKLNIPNNCPKEQAELLTRCWEAEDWKRPTMGEVIEMIKVMPTTDPEYIMICDTKQPSAKSVVEFLKEKMNLKPVIPEKPSPPKRKGKGVSKSEISNPTDFRTVLSVQPEGNNKFTIHDYEVERQRHKSSRDYSGLGTLPRAGTKNGTLGGSYVSTPDLNLDLDVTTKLERTNAVRRKPGGRGGDQSIVSSCLPSLDDNVSFVLSPLAASTPMDHSFDTNTIQIVDDRESSVESSTSKKSKGILKNLANQFRRKSQEHHDVCYDPTTKKYHNMVSKPTFPGEDLINAELSPAAQVSWPLSNNEGSTGRFTKLQDLPLNQRVKRRTGHQKNPSNASDKIDVGRKTPPLYHQSNSEGGLTPTTPKNLSGSNWGSISPGAQSLLSTVLPFPSSSPTTPGSIDDGIKKRTGSYVELRPRAPTTGFLMEAEKANPPPVIHSRSKSNDVHVGGENQEVLNSLVNRLNKFTEQTVVENYGYHAFDQITEKSRVSSNRKSDQEHHHYKALKNNLPAIPPRRSTDAGEAPPRPPRSSLLDTVIELPKSVAPTIPARNHGHTMNTSAYLTLDSGRSQSSSPSSPGSSLQGLFVDDTPTTTAPVLIRPDSLDLGKPRGATGIQRGHPYVQLATNFRADNGTGDTPPNRVPHIPLNIQRH